MSSKLPSDRLVVSVDTTVNGKTISQQIPSNYTLAEFLRENLNLTGTKLGCNRAECGACTVLVDGIPVFSCTTLAAEVNSKKVDTVEGLATDSELHPLQEAFVKLDALQCGFCTPGLLMSLKALYDKERSPTIDQVKDSIAGNYCRCGAYQNIFEAAIEAARSTRR